MTAITVSPIVLRDVDPPIIKAAQVPEGEYLIDTRPGRRDGSRPVEVVPGPVEPGAATLLFADDFNAQEDWNASFNEGSENWAEDGANVPAGWDAVRTTGGWSPSRGYLNGKESLYITGEPEYQENPGEKAAVFWRFARESTAFWADSILAKVFRDGLDEVFVRFRIKFQPGWTDRGSTKIFRVQGWNSLDKSLFWSGSDVYPAMIWNYSYTSLGFRNTLSPRSFPRNGDLWNNPAPIGLPRSITGGEISNSWNANSFDLNGDGTQDNDPQIPDLVNGGFLQNNTSVISHAQVMGDRWHTMEFYLKMNSAPGALDGEFRQWLDGQLVAGETQWPWMQNDSPPGVKWRGVKFGGNDSWTGDENGPVSDSEERMEWYAISRVEIYDGLPEGLA